MHTESPWRVAYDTRIEYGPILAGKGFAVATILRDPPEWQANARLIAAAPALLEACKAVLLFRATDMHTDPWGERKIVYQQVDAAIALTE